MSDSKQKALDFIFQYGGFDGSHHKQWVLDQVVRILTETDEKYNQWTKEFQGELDSTGEYEYGEWEKGSPP